MMLVRVAVLVAVAATMALAAPAPYDPPQQARDPPQQVHIALGNTEGTAMVISWLTNDAKRGSVFYGTTKGALDNQVNEAENAERYHYRNLFGEDYTSGLIHHVKLDGLKPLTKYYYRCGQDEYGFSEVFSFTTPPNVGSKTYIFNIIGDLGQTANSSSTLDHIKADKDINMTVLVGDLSYADSSYKSTPTRNCTQRRWDSWGELVQPVFANQPLMTIPGNHEIEQHGGPPATQERFLAYQKRLRMPSKESGATHGNLYYSFNAGPAHFVMLNSYMPFNKSSDQYQWLLQDLKKVDRGVTPWLFVTMHAPWYNSNVYHHNEPEETEMRTAMEEIMYNHEVDAIFAGHVHAYERMHPVYKNKTDPEAPTYLNIGDAGNREGPAYLYFPRPEWSAYREPAFGHARIHIYNATHAHWTWHKNMNREPIVSDDVWLVRQSALDTPYTRGLAHLGAREFDGFAPYKSF